MDFYDDDDDKPKATKHIEWECPDCNANNPVEEGFKIGDEVFCFYCGVEFKVRERDGRLRFVET